MKNIKTYQKHVSSLVKGAQFEISDHCLRCGDLTDISRLNLVTGKCPACDKMNIDKLKALFLKGLKDD